MNGSVHIPVLLNEVLGILAPRTGETYVDATAGLGGHAAAVAKVVGPAGVVVLNDLDPTNLSAAERRVREVPGVGIVAIRGNYADLPRLLVAREPPISADMVLADLGFSSNQIEAPARGFSFAREGPLDMRMDPGAPVTAAELVGSLGEAELSDLIRDFGEDRAHRRIARKLVEARADAPILTTTRLAEVVRSASAGRSHRDSIDPATRTFQALRIAVNDELGSLESFLSAIARGCAAVRAGRPGWLRAGARVAIISFHSLEDRLVKHAFADVVGRDLAVGLTRGPVEAGAPEVGLNPRARSAKLRAIRLH